MKAAVVVFALCLTAVAGCASTSFKKGEVMSNYAPVAVGGASAADSAVVKVTDGLFIWKVDDKELLGHFARFSKFGSKPDSVSVGQGKHNIHLMWMGQSLAVNGLETKVGHEYLVEYLQKDVGKRSSINYWVRDVSAGEVVSGKEIRPEDMKN